MELADGREVVGSALKCMTRTKTSPTKRSCQSESGPETKLTEKPSETREAGLTASFFFSILLATQACQPINYTKQPCGTNNRSAALTTAQQSKRAKACLEKQASAETGL